MKSEAIRCAIKLYSEPTLLARFNDPFRKLPRGVTELLRIVSSDTALKNISLKNNLHSPRLKKVLVNYIQLVLLQDDNSNRRKLGLNSSSNTEQVKLHYKLLMNIFHPDKSAYDIKFSQTILQAYKSLKKSQKNITDTPSTTKASPPLRKKYSYRSKKITLPKARKKDSLRKVTLIRGSIIAIFIMILGMLLLTPSSPQLISKNNSDSFTMRADRNKSAGWRNPRARNTQRETTKFKVFTQ